VEAGVEVDNVVEPAEEGLSLAESLLLSLLGVTGFMGFDPINGLGLA
jgi:hypothetical protein